MSEYELEKKNNIKKVKNAAQSQGWEVVVEDDTKMLGNGISFSQMGVEKSYAEMTAHLWTTGALQ